MQLVNYPAQNTPGVFSNVHTFSSVRPHAALHILKMYLKLTDEELQKCIQNEPM